MSLQTDVAKKKAEVDRPTRCKLSLLREELDAEDQMALDDAIKYVRLNKASLAWLVEVLNDNGHHIGKTVVREHVRKECVCAGII